MEIKTTKDIVEDLRAIDLQSIMYKLKNYDDVGNVRWVRVDEVIKFLKAQKNCELVLKEFNERI